MRDHYDVLVVGGGVIGAAAALAFSRAGLAVGLLEQGAMPAVPLPGDDIDLRVYALAPGSVRYLDSLGAWATIAAYRTSPFRQMEVWDSDPERRLDFDTAGMPGPELGHIVEDRVLRFALWSALGGVDLRVGQRATGFRFEAGCATLNLADGTSLQAGLVVAAEGADSDLRRWADIDTTGWNYSQRSIVCHLQTEQPHRAAAYQRFMAKGPLALLPLSDGRSSIVWSTDLAHAEELLALDDAGFGERVERAIQQRLGRVLAVSPRRSFPLRLLHAESYVRPGLALVGDSAHVVHPLAGQGVNLGLADVEALVSILVEARRQRRDWSLRVLQRYERRRKAANLEMLALTEGLFRLFRQTSATAVALREAGMFLLNRIGPLKGPLTRRAMGL